MNQKNKKYLAALAAAATMGTYCYAPYADLGVKLTLNPLVASPAANVTACCSAIPTSKNRFGYMFRNLLSPVPSGMAAVIATTFGLLSPSLHITVEKISV